MGETAAETQREIGETRAEISATLDELEAAIRRLLDWQARVRRQPMLYAGIALVAGFVVAGGPKRGLTHLYWRLRPGARRKALANRHLLQLQETLDATLAGLPPGVAERAKALRLVIEKTDKHARPDGTIVIAPKGSTLEQMAVRASESAASVAAGLITKRLLDEMNGAPPPKGR